MISLVMASLQQRIRIDTTSNPNPMLLKKMHQPLLKRLLPLSIKKLIHQKISQQSLQKRKHQLLPKRLLLLSTIKFQRISPLLNNRRIRKLLQVR
jgi:hypothetical protein